MLDILENTDTVHEALADDAVPCEWPHLMMRLYHLGRPMEEICALEASFELMWSCGNTYRFCEDHKNVAIESLSRGRCYRTGGICILVVVERL